MRHSQVERAGYLKGGVESQQIFAHCRASVRLSDGEERQCQVFAPTLLVGVACHVLSAELWASPLGGHLSLTVGYYMRGWIGTGGKTKCSGRFLAKYFVTTFVATLLRRFDIKMVGQPHMPQPDVGRPVLGIISVKEGDDYMVSITKRIHLDAKF
jgi:hypothetical protein